jgi:hypothetical protein
MLFAEASKQFELPNQLSLSHQICLVSFKRGVTDACSCETLAIGDKFSADRKKSKFASKV